MPARAPVTKPWGASRKTPIARLGEQGQTSGAKYALKPARRKVRQKSRTEQGVHTPVRVGSAAMPAPFALRIDDEAFRDSQVAPSSPLLPPPLTATFRRNFGAFRA